MMAPHELFLLCQRAVMENVSDIHLKPGSKPFCRDANGKLRPLTGDAEILSEDAVLGLCYHLYGVDINERGSNRSSFSGPRWQHMVLIDEDEPEHPIDEAVPKSIRSLINLGYGEADASATISLPGGSSASLRINAYYSQVGLNLAIRVLRSNVMSARDIWLPNSLWNLIHKKEGLIIFCGATGSGKTTAMYSLLDMINHEDSKHIITLDDPSEIILKEDKCIISQREIGVHAESFDQALRAALREDPDVLLVGEMRDRETIRIALQAAETGHLVLSTIHASSVSEVVDRIVSYFNAEEAVQLRSALAASFLAMVACKLLPLKAGGRGCAYEVLLRTVATTAVVKNGNMMQISDYMSREHGMQTMKDSIDSLRAMGILEENSYG